MGIFRALKAAITGRHQVNSSGSVPAENSLEDRPGSNTSRNDVRVVPREILFVESNPGVVEGLRASLPELGPAWPFRIATSGEQGLKCLADSRVEGVAVAISLSDMPGLEFLRRASEVAPTTVGMLRATPEDRVAFGKNGGLAPHFLPHAPNAEELGETLQRIFQLMRWMSEPSIRSLMGRMENLPAVPALYARVMRELRSEEPSIESVGKLISHDPALTAKMLQMVNSPVFALGRPICEAIDAVTFLGAERTKALILIASLSLHGSLTPCEGFSQESFWQHSLTVATLARTLALKELKNAGLADACFTAGLLHDIGKLLFASNLPTEYGQVTNAAKTAKTSIGEWELKAFGVSHGELGASLLGMWGLPMPVLEAIAWHEHPRSEETPGFSTVTIVHAANVLEYEKRGLAGGDGVPQFEMEYLATLGLADRLNHWRALCGCPSKPEPAQAA